MCELDSKHAHECYMVKLTRSTRKRKVGAPEDSIENGGERLLAHRQEAQFTLWRPQYNWDELEEQQSPETARVQPTPVIPTRGGAPRQVFRRDDGVQVGETGHLPPGYVYRRIPGQNNDWERDPGPRLTATASALERHYAQRQ
jgi:hypothetical protein